MGYSIRGRRCARGVTVDMNSETGPGPADGRAVTADALRGLSMAAAERGEAAQLAGRSQMAQRLYGWSATFRRAAAEVAAEVAAEERTRADA